MFAMCSREQVANVRTKFALPVPVPIKAPAERSSAQALTSQDVVRKYL